MQEKINTAAPMVSVSLTTYNQEKYIAQAIESALAQKTDFHYEILIADDCSTDDTWQICLSYQEKYPEKIKALRYDKNVGAVRNYLTNYERCSGKYVAFLEGDDTWCDPKKLQKQVDFLENNDDYVICCHQVEIIDKNGESKGTLLKNVKDTSTVYDLCEGDYISTPSCMVRKILAGKIPEWIYQLPGCDWPFDILHAQHGKIKYLPDTMACYRVHDQGIWNIYSEMQKHLIGIQLVKTVDQHLDYKYTKRFSVYLKHVKYEIRSLKREKWRKYRFYRAARFIKNLIVNFGRHVIKPILKRMKARAIFHYTINTITKNIRKLRSIALRFYNSRLPKDDLVILDESFPHPQSAFRYTEFNAYLQKFEKIKIYTTGASFSFFKDNRPVSQVIQEYLDTHSDYQGKVFQYPAFPILNAKLAYIVFAGNADYFLDDLTSNKIPFVFTLYPGGTFALDDVASDKRLKRIFSSPYFRKVIITQKITYDYLLKKDFCRADDIVDIYGVVTPLEALTKNVSGKMFFADGKQNLDICFAAHKYMPQGVDKGYDVFINVAKSLAGKYENIRFHVVGGFSEKDMPLDGIEDKITFYGNQSTSWFNQFYKDKDIFLSPNIPFVLRPGAFDGFPTGSCTEAAIHEVAMFCTDELKLNCKFTDGKDIAIIPYDIAKIVDIISHYYQNPETLKQLAQAGRLRVQEVYGYEGQIAPRIHLLEQELAKIIGKTHG